MPQPAAGAGRARQFLALALACLVVVVVAAARSVSDASAEQDMAGSWTTLAPSNLKRQEVSFAEAGGRLYLFGGTFTERQQVYDPAANSWADTAAPPNVSGKLDHVQGVSVGGKIYYIGGLTAWPTPEVGTVHVYDPARNEWSLGTDMGARRRGAGGVAVHNGRIYYAGGLRDGKAVAWLDVYDPVARTWRQLDDMPTPRDHFAAAVLDGKLWAIGGRGGAGQIENPTDVNEAFDLTSEKWSTGYRPLPTRRGGFAAAALGCEIIIIGGEGAGPFEGAFKTVQAYHPPTNTWRTLENLEPQRHGIQAAVLGSDIYVAAGGTKQGGGGATDLLQRLTVGPQPACPPTSGPPAPAPAPAPARRLARAAPPRPGPRRRRRPRRQARRRPPPRARRAAALPPRSLPRSCPARPRPGRRSSPRPIGRRPPSGACASRASASTRRPPAGGTGPRSGSRCPSRHGSSSPSAAGPAAGSSASPGRSAPAVRRDASPCASRDASAGGGCPPGATS